MHDASVIPSQFVGRLGDLRECSFQGDFISTLAYDEEMLRSGEEYAYAIGDQIHYGAQPIVAGKIKIGLDIRTILPEKLVPPPRSETNRRRREETITKSRFSPHCD